MNSHGFLTNRSLARSLKQAHLRNHPIPKSTCRSYSLTAAFSGNKTPKKKERVVIVGSGWAGYGFARALDPSKYERIIVSPRSYFVFTPLLASTAVGTLEFRSVLESIRRLPGPGVDFYQGWADHVDFAAKTIHVEANPTDDLASQTVIPTPTPTPTPTPRAPKGPTVTLPYDKLVIACGAYSQTFNIPGVREHAHFLRDIGDARRIRLRVLSLFEQCAHPSPTSALTESDRRALLHFAVVGGGPTGIEFAAELHDLIYEDLARLYPALIPLVRITVYDIAPKILPMFDQALAQYATATFARQGIAVRTEHHLTSIRPAAGTTGALALRLKESGDEDVGAGMVVWSTGLMQNPFVRKLEGTKFSLPEDTSEYTLLSAPKTGGITTDAFLRAQITTTTSSDQTPRTLPDVFALGDCATIAAVPTLPKTAQVASQQAAFLAKHLNDPSRTTKGFEFRNWGTMTYLGSWKAIHQSARDELRGWVAWLVWRGAYLTRTLSVRNKVMVPVYWAVSWVFGRDISRF
ncbi:NAD(P)H dehydrogenase [Podospora conica]|nr:NAD(P)H dehydrogenase [Schizothecium conicum]